MKYSIISKIAGLEKTGKDIIRFGIVIVFLWIGGLKFFTYEADGIVPFVANSPMMSFFYQYPNDYRSHVNREGEFITENHSWHVANNTYDFSYGLGTVIVILAILVGMHHFVPLTSMVASILIFIMTLGTLSFLVTTPECWVPHLTDSEWGFPYLSGRGRLVIKDLVILGGAIITMSESARIYLSKNIKEQS